MTTGLTQLGSKTPIPNSPEEAELQAIIITTENPALRDAVVRLSCPEFTSLCPVTGQPDFARIYVDYIPNKLLIESKSIKLFFASFRNHGAFHEVCSVLIGTKLRDVLEPRWLRVTAIWYARGGIPIDVFWETGERPKGIPIPELNLTAYTGR